MIEKIPDKIKERINNRVEQAFELLINKASKGEYLENIIKSLIVEKIMNYLAPLISRPLVKKLAKQGVKKAVDHAWETNKEKLQNKLKFLK